MERESSLDERLRKDAEIAADNKQRQIRLGDIPAPIPTEVPKTRSGRKGSTKK